MATARALDPVTAYATDVVEGREVAGRKVRLACVRHLTDLRTAGRRGLVWRPDEAMNAIDFFPSILCLPEETEAGDVVEEHDPDAAPKDGAPFVLTRWEQFIVGSLIGWYSVKGYRRFRIGYIETAKGSGKTPLCVGILIYIWIVDGEKRAQFFAAGNTKEQAQIAFADAEAMVKASPVLRDLIDQKVNNLAYLEKGSFFRAISAEHRGLDGKRVSGAIIDEAHEQRTAVVMQKMRKGTKGRRNALILEPTNAGYDRTSVCWHHHEYSTKVLEGTVEDDAWFAFIASLDPCEDHRKAGHEFPVDDCAACDSWQVEGPHWLKANPNLGVTISWQYLRELVRVAIGMPSEVNDLLRFNFGIWTTAHSRYLDMGQWHACTEPLPTDEELALHKCYAGVDLGETDDLSAFARVWDLEDGRIAVKLRAWIPEATLEKKPDRPYAEWQRAGILEVTPGNITDFDQVEDAIATDCQASGVRECAYDKRFAQQMALHLEGRGVTMIDTPQGFLLNEPIKKLNTLVNGGQLLHGQNALLSWAASNLVVRHGRNKEVRLDKEKASEKIDPISALVMALARVIVHAPNEGASIYDTRGLATL